MTQFIKLSTPFSGGTTIIPNTFFDEYMPHANGFFVKVYLYLLRCLQAGMADISVSEIADLFDLTDGDIIRALRYWEKEGLLDENTDESGNITVIRLYPAGRMNTAETGHQASGPSDTALLEHSERSDAPDSAATTRHINESDIESPNIAPADSKNSLHLDAGKADVSEKTAGDENFMASDQGHELLMVVEQYLGHPLSRTDIDKIAYFHDNLGFSFDLIDYLFDYCVSNGKKDIRYIEKVALAWARNKIDTVEEARMETTLHQASSYAIMTELGLGSRRPAPGEMEYIRKWIRDYGFSLDMVLEACRRTVMKIHSPSFEYADSILRRWNEAGITTIDQAQIQDREHDEKLAAARKTHKDSGKKQTGRVPNRFHNFSQRDNKYDEIERRLFLKNHPDLNTGSDNN